MLAILRLKFLTMKRILSIAVAATLSFGIFSCKKSSGGDSPGNTTPAGKTVLIKITLSPAVLPQNADFSGAVNGLLPNSSIATWKVNGVTRTSETTIAFSQADFKSGVITFETTAPIRNANLAVNGLVVGQTSYTALVETTLDGKAQDPVTISVTSTMQRSFSYF
jgi:hypothetical protein